MIYTLVLFFFFNDTATTEIYTLSLHDALPIYTVAYAERALAAGVARESLVIDPAHDFGKNTFHSLELTRRLGEMVATGWPRSEEHTSELQSRQYLVCRLLLEKKKNKQRQQHPC